MAKRQSTSLQKSTPKTVSLPARVMADRVVSKLREAEKALEYATTVHQAKLVADVAAAQEVFAHRQRMSEQVTGYAHQIKIYALAKLGELIAAAQEAGEISSKGRPRKSSIAEHLSGIGIDRKTSAVAQQLATLPMPVRDAIASKEKTLAQARREQRLSQVEPVELPAGKFRVLYADPPWHYGNSGVINDESDNYGRAARHYPSMTIAELCAMDVPSRVADRAVLFMWVTSPLLAECWPVIKAWGFVYKASMVWDKVDHNFGNYVSVRHELLLICTRGSCLPDHPTPMPDSVISIARSDVHSEKPEEFRAVIDRLYTGGADQKLELFGRKPVDGWTQFGNEMSKAS